MNPKTAQPMHCLQLAPKQGGDTLSRLESMIHRPGVLKKGTVVNVLGVTRGKVFFRTPGL